MCSLRAYKFGRFLPNLDIDNHATCCECRGFQC